MKTCRSSDASTGGALFCKTGVLKNFGNFREKTCVGVSFLINVIKKRLQHMCFPVKMGG